jgi:hypothetical protein
LAEDDDTTTPSKGTKRKAADDLLSAKKTKSAVSVGSSNSANIKDIAEADDDDDEEDMKAKKKTTSQDHIPNTAEEGPIKEFIEELTKDPTKVLVPRDPPQDWFPEGIPDLYGEVSLYCPFHRTTPLSLSNTCFTFPFLGLRGLERQEDPMCVHSSTTGGFDRSHSGRENRACG